MASNSGVAFSLLFSIFKKASYPTQCCPAKALAWMTPIRTRIRVCQRIMKTPARLLTGHVESSKANVLGIFFKVKEKANSTVRFLKLYPLKNSYVRKLDSSPVGIESPCC